ncbi:hypothetical protein C8D81_1614 [Enemella evansiae]|nr:hypothetical protein C8D81_1614 [Enemella evansiae]
MARRARADNRLSDLFSTLLGMETIEIDCGTCIARPKACSDCVISVLMGVPEDRHDRVELATEEQEALAVLADQGLVPPLRLVRPVPPEEPESLPVRFAGNL